MGSHPAQAQGPDIPFYVPIVSVGVVSFIVFFACVCIIVCCIAKHSRSTRSTFTHYLTGVHVDTRQQRGQGYLAGVGAQASYPPQSSTPYPTSPAGSTSHTVPVAVEPVSLPEATLHRGDAPPGYNEAITMKTIDTAHDPKSTENVD